MDDLGNFKTNYLDMSGKAVLAFHSTSEPSVFLVVNESESPDKQGAYSTSDVEGMKARASQAQILAQESGDTWFAVVFDLSFKGGELDYHGTLAQVFHRLALPGHCQNDFSSIQPDGGKVVGGHAIRRSGVVGAQCA